MIVYFSGTGNSRHAAQRIAAALGDRAVSTEKQEPRIVLARGEPFGIVCPTYWWELPPFMRDWLKRLTLDGAGYTFLVATCGTTPGCCGEDARRLLKKKGVKLSASFSVKMPDTWTPVFDLSDSEKVAEQNRQAEGFIDEVIRRVKAGETGNHTKGRMPLATRLLTHPLLNSARRTRHFRVEDACVGCGRCAGGCPVSAIEIREGRPVWVKEQCTLCLRCLHRCPAFAIQYGSGATGRHGQYVHPCMKDAP